MVVQEVLNYANKILLSIGEPFLTEGESVGSPTTLDDLSILYTYLFSIMQTRLSTQDSFDRLKARAVLDYVTLSETVTTKEESSNILLGFGVDV